MNDKDLLQRAIDLDKRRPTIDDNSRLPLVRAWLHGEVSTTACATALKTSPTGWTNFVGVLTRRLAQAGRLRELEQPEKETP